MFRPSVKVSGNFTVWATIRNGNQSVRNTGQVFDSVEEATDWGLVNLQMSIGRRFIDADDIEVVVRRAP